MDMYKMYFGFCRHYITLQTPLARRIIFCVCVKSFQKRPVYVCKGVLG
jgi:hypothetical protein